MQKIKAYEGITEDKIQNAVLDLGSSGNKIIDMFILEVSDKFFVLYEEKSKTEPHPQDIKPVQENNSQQSSFIPIPLQQGNFSDKLRQNWYIVLFVVGLIIYYFYTY